MSSGTWLEYSCIRVYFVLQEKPMSFKISRHWFLENKKIPVNMQISFAKDLNEQNNSSLSFWLIFLLLSVVYSLVIYYHKKNVVVYTQYLSTAKICAMIR